MGQGGVALFTPEAHHPAEGATSTFHDGWYRRDGDASGIREFAVFRAHGHLIGAAPPIGTGRTMAAREERRLPGYVPLTSPYHPHWRGPDPSKPIGKGLAFMLAHADELFERPERAMVAEIGRRVRRGSLRTRTTSLTNVDICRRVSRYSCGEAHAAAF